MTVWIFINALVAGCSATALVAAYTTLPDWVCNVAGLGAAMAVLVITESRWL